MLNNRSTSTDDFISVLRPQLPTANELLPYLSRIDASRVYTNYGPLSSELEERCCGLLDLPPGSFLSASSGTAALVGAILAHAGRADSKRPLAIVPALTFVATAIAVEQCGYAPFLVDVDPETWMLDAEALLNEAALNRVGVVIPVAPFGRPVPQDQWRAFSEKTGIPVVIDGAASFDLLQASSLPIVGKIPVALSFHATKSFSTGEGGGVVTTDGPLAYRVSRSLNFGFSIVRECNGPSLNGKMSEYHAAVGLAELDGWKAKLAALNRVGSLYRKYARAYGVESYSVTSPDVSACYALFRARDPVQAAVVAEELASNLIDYRWWYGRGLHHQPHFAKAERGNLDVTEKIAPSLLGLPVAWDIGEESIERIVAHLSDGIRRRPC